MKFTEEEKICMLKAMDSLIKADDHIAEQEVEFLEVMLEEFGWDSNFLQRLEDFKEEDAMKAIQNISQDKITYFQSMLFELANSDNDINEKELKYIDYINEYILERKV